VIAGRYRVEMRVGVGGMGAVYRAIQQDLERNVAIKVVASTALENPEIARRFRREAEIISRLYHPSTLKLFDFGRLPDGRPFLVTEFLEGQTLGALLEASPLPWRRTLRLLRQVCASLEEAHARGVIHRDLKPDNVFVIDVHGEDVAKVLDFGIAKLGSSSDTVDGLVFGTPAYMSPEQAAGHPATEKSDLYSVGVIAYRCLTGQPPFAAEQPMALLLKHLHEPPVPLRRVVDTPGLIPGPVENLALSLLEKQPERRPASAADVRATIDVLLGDAPWAQHDAEVALASAETATDPPLPVAPAPEDDSGPLPLETPGRPAKRAALVLLALLALILGGAAALWAGWPETPAPAIEIPAPPARAPALPPPLEPTTRAPARDAAEDLEESPPRRGEPKPRRRRGPRPRRRRPAPPSEPEPAEEDVKPPPGFFDFEIDE
jgi:serine/threonine-protein kinase